MAKIRKGDMVQVIAGKDKDHSGKVIGMVDGGKKVLVEKLNMHKRHRKARKHKEAGIVAKEAPLDISNVALLSPTTGKPVRVGFKTVQDSKGRERKVRVVHKTGEVLDKVP
jgi:large subunit ribosomal protein L24